jgi:hypothetical protein
LLLGKFFRLPAGVRRPNRHVKFLSGPSLFWLRELYHVLDHPWELHLLQVMPWPEPTGQVHFEKEEDMRRLLLPVTLLGVFSMCALAANFSGKLVDASCYDQQKKVAGCDATSTTTAFAIEVSGTVLKLDSAGNAKAADAIKNRADRTDPSKPQPKEVMAKVTGTEKGGTIAVEDIAVQ